MAPQRTLSFSCLSLYPLPYHFLPSLFCLILLFQPTPPNLSYTSLMACMISNHQCTPFFSFTKNSLYIASQFSLASKVCLQRFVFLSFGSLVISIRISLGFSYEETNLFHSVEKCFS